MITLCTEDDVTAIRSMDPSAKLTRQIEQASRWVQYTKLRRDFQAATGLKELTTYGGELDYWISRPPIRTLTSIEFRLNTGGWEVQTYVTGAEPITDYEIVPTQEQKDRTAGRIHFRERVWPGGIGNARITYDGGLYADAGAVSQDLRYATALVVVYGLNQDIRGGPGVQARTLTGETSEIITFADRAAGEEVEEILDGWRVGG